MLSLANRILLGTLTALLLGAAPAVADPGTTGGVPAAEPPVLSPQGGLAGSSQVPPATAAQTEEEAPGTDEPATTTPTTTTPEEPTGDGDSTVDVPAADPAPETESAVRPSTSSGGGGLPRTGFALAALIAIGSGFVLTGYALRYSRALDG
jgi:hypothetical protein